MKVHDFLSGAETLPLVDLDAITRGGGLLVVAPHPDDESLGCGGLIAEACARGIAVRLVIVSDGTGSHPGSRLYPPHRLRALREAETIVAASALGLDPCFIRFLRLPDAAVPVSGPEADRAVEAIVSAATECGASTICVTWRHDPHCDHRAAAILVDSARDVLGGCRVLAYPIWGWTLPPETEVVGPVQGIRLDITGHLSRKRAAILAHRSQTTDLIDDDPEGFRLDGAMLDRFARPFEIFLDSEPSP